MFKNCCVWLIPQSPLKFFLRLVLTELVPCKIFVEISHIFLLKRTFFELKIAYIHIFTF